MEDERWWQVQDAKQRFSELLRAVQAEGAQFVTRHGKEVAVVLDIAHYQQLTGTRVTVDFKEALTEPVPGVADEEFAAALDGVVAARGADIPRDVALD